MVCRPRHLSKSAIRQNALSCRRVAAAAAEAGPEAEAEAAPAPAAAEKIDIKTIQVGQTLKGTVVSTNISRSLLLPPLLPVGSNRGSR